MSIFAETHQPVSCQSNQPLFCTLLLFQRLPEVNIQVTVGFISRTEFPASLSVICSTYAKMSQFLIWKTRHGIKYHTSNHIQTISYKYLCEFLASEISLLLLTAMILSLLITVGLAFITDLGIPVGNSLTFVLLASPVKGDEHERRICSSTPRCTAKLCLKSSFGDS